MSLLKWVIISCLSIGSIFIPHIFRLSEAAFYFLFFIFGYYCFNSRESIKFIHTKTLVCLWFVLIILIGLKILLLEVDIPYHSIFNIFDKIILGIIGSLLLLNICFKLTKYSILLIIGSWNGFFGVYLFHQFFLKLLIYKTDILYNTNRYLYPIILFIFSLAFSILLSTLFLKNKFLKKLI